ncbi:ankyrin repeat protein [Colletotrichum tofieldiae]|nr:ankyrin repeat protein [Colletotrichum tofieldiae]
MRLKLEADSDEQVAKATDAARGSEGHLPEVSKGAEDPQMYRDEVMRLIPKIIDVINTNNKRARSDIKSYIDFQMLLEGGRAGMYKDRHSPIATVHEYLRVYRQAGGDPEKILKIIEEEDLEELLSYWVRATKFMIETSVQQPNKNPPTNDNPPSTTDGPSEEKLHTEKPEEPSIFFTDVIGRKYTIPFRLCQSWPYMESFIQKAFPPVNGIGAQVQNDCYDLLSPNGEIVLPQVWEKAVMPGWVVTMSLWTEERRPSMSKLYSDRRQKDEIRTDGGAHDTTNSE